MATPHNAVMIDHSTMQRLMICTCWNDLPRGNGQAHHRVKNGEGGPYKSPIGRR